jgi:hypothetical protein
MVIISNLSMLFQKSHFRGIARHSRLLAFFFLLLELVALLPKLNALYPIRVRIIFSWIFLNNSFSNIYLIFANMIVIIYLLFVGSYGDLFL